MRLACHVGYLSAPQWICMYSSPPLSFLEKRRGGKEKKRKKREWVMIFIVQVVSHIGVVSVALRLCSCTLSQKIQRANVCVPWLIHMCAMTYSHVCHDMAHSYVCHALYDSFICVPWLIHMCAMTHSYVCHDSFICVPCVILLILMCAMTQSRVWHDSSILGICRIQMWDMTSSFERHVVKILIVFLLRVFPSFFFLVL